MSEEKKEKKLCSICKSEYKGYGNQARPINDGICCDECNVKVINARLNMLVNMYSKPNKR